ncbi:MAG: helix-turn-helix transcriptional regulator [Acidobacteria bacterium]|nr:helix-turn-helix transcriptional regulator [Acidobacteriota bacterium]MBI3427404.1 helix-turn-helix transcriptional regulator [Acidobacteriota bacterium]
MLTSSVEVLWTARYDYQPSWKLEPHAHDYFQIIYFVSGSGSILLDDHEQAITPGDLFLIKPQQRHGLTVGSVVNSLDLKFVVKDGHLQHTLRKAANHFAACDAAIPHLFERIRQEGEGKGPLFRELCGAYLLEMLILLLRQERRPKRNLHLAKVPLGGPADAVSKRIVEFIQQHYAEDVHLPEIARALGMSDRRIRQKFQESVGVPPMRYLLQCRVEHAQELISYSDYALKEIAELTGFKSIHHFTRVFSEIAGVAPGVWRQQNRQGIRKDVYINPHFSNTIWTITDAA